LLRDSIAEESTPLRDSIAEESTPLRDSIAEESAPLRDSIAEESAPLRDSIAEESTPLRDSIAEESAPLRDSIAEESAPLRDSIANAMVNFVPVVTAAGSYSLLENDHSRLLNRSSEIHVEVVVVASERGNHMALTRCHLSLSCWKESPASKIAWKVST
jgi:hypothetical protein